MIKNLILSLFLTIIVSLIKGKPGLVKGGGLALTGLSRGPLHGLGSAWAGTSIKGFIVEGLGQKEGYSVKKLTGKVFEAAGGITRLIRPPGSLPEKEFLRLCQRCGLCMKVCPTSPKAIFLQNADVPGPDGKSLSVKLPYVDLKKCVGCGICEFKCPVRGRPAIRVIAVREARSLKNQILL
jgi:ferredoxin